MNLPRTIDVAILGAVSLEIDALVGQLHSTQVVSWQDGLFHVGFLGKKSVLIAATGLGKVNAAVTTSVILASYSVGQVWNIGCAGAYPGGPLRVGDVLITKECLCGDEGIFSGAGVLSAEGIGIPILVRRGEKFFDRIPLNPEQTAPELCKKTPPGWYRLGRGPLPSPASMPAPGAEDLASPDFDPAPKSGDEELTGAFKLVYGPSLTVGMVSGDFKTARGRFEHYGAFAESMEGSAVAQACFRFSTPMLECRGMSNEVGNRSKEHWELKKAIANCHGIILNWL